MNLDRIRELCAGAVLADLDPTELAELQAAPDQELVRREIAAFERAGAEVIALLGSGGVEPMPHRLREKLAQSALSFARPSPREGSAVAPPRRAAAGLGWYFAAAAALIAALAWLPRGGKRELPIERQRLAFLESHPRSKRLPWEKGCEGEVLWSSDAQSGFLTLRGLPANDPTQFQYQLWIFDRARDTATPVDGGVFDVPQAASPSEVIVAIEAKLRVDDAFAFAITKEKPGGVVVSAKSPEQIVAVVGL